MKLLRTINRLSWKHVILTSFLFSFLAAGITAQNALYEATHTQTKATLIPPTPTRSVIYPQNPPVLIRLEPWFGKPGDTLRLRGLHFGAGKGMSQITVNNEEADVLAWSDAAIDVKIPQTHSGLLTVTIGNHPPLTIPLSVTEQPTDPQLYFVQNELWLKNLKVSATLTINSEHIFNLSPAESQRVTTLNPQDLIHASLKDEQLGDFLPLSLPPDALLLP